MKLFYRDVATDYWEYLGSYYDEKDVNRRIQQFLDEHHYKSYYTRTWVENGSKWFDVGSHTEFFVVRGYSHRKYLDDAGIYRFRPDLENDNEVFKQQRATYGFDEREIFDLRDTFYQWLYEHLKMYLEKRAVQEHYYEFHGERYHQREIIEMILTRVEFFFSTDFDEETDSDWRYVKQIEELWGMICHDMWC